MKYVLLTSLAALLVYRNHLQGVGIAALGLAAVIGWRSVEARTSNIWWIGGAALVASLAAVTLLPRHPALADIYQPAGWFNPAYGFDLFSSNSPAYDRALAILGFSGLVSVGAAIALLRCNHLAAWLTLTPIVALSLPVFAIPFANAIAVTSRAVEQLATFHRFLLAVPVGLSVLILVQKVAANRLPEPRPGAREENVFPEIIPRLKPAQNRSRRSSIRDQIAYWSLAMVPVLILTLPAASPAYSRLWHSLTVPPADLDSKKRLRRENFPFRAKADPTAVTPVLATPDVAVQLHSIGATNTPTLRKQITFPELVSPSASASALLEKLRIAVASRESFRIVAAPPTSLFTPRSQAAFLSGHWLSQEIALARTGLPEIWSELRRLVSEGSLIQESPSHFHAQFSPLNTDSH